MTVLAGNPFQMHFDSWRTFTHLHRWKPPREQDEEKILLAGEAVHVSKGS
jgi:hypothetical protein